MRPIPATRLGDAHGLLRAIEKRGRLRTDEFVTEFNLDELFPPGLENAVGRMRHFISFGRLAGLVKEDRGVVELTDIGKRYVRSEDPGAPYDVSSQQAEWLRRQLRERHMTDSIFHGLAIGLSLLASVPAGTRISTMDFGRSMAYLGRAGWDNENTLLIQGERHLILLDDLELIDAEHRLTPTGEQVRAELTLPVHMSLPDIAAQLNPGGAEAVRAAAQQEFAAPAAPPSEPAVEPAPERVPEPEPTPDVESSPYRTVISSATGGVDGTHGVRPPVVPRPESSPNLPADPNPATGDPLLPFAGGRRHSGLTPGDPLKGPSSPPTQIQPAVTPGSPAAAAPPEATGVPPGSPAAGAPPETAGIVPGSPVAASSAPPVSSAPPPAGTAMGADAPSASAAPPEAAPVAPPAETAAPLEAAPVAPPVESSAAPVQTPAGSSAPPAAQPAPVAAPVESPAPSAAPVEAGPPVESSAPPVAPVEAGPSVESAAPPAAPVEAGPVGAPVESSAPPAAPVETPAESSAQAPGQPVPVDAPAESSASSAASPVAAGPGAAPADSSVPSAASSVDAASVAPPPESSAPPEPARAIDPSPAAGDRSVPDAAAGVPAAAAVSTPPPAGAPSSSVAPPAARPAPVAVPAPAVDAPALAPPTTPADPRQPAFVDAATIRAAAIAAGLRLPAGVYANAAAALGAGKHLLLTGAPGSGKTALALAITRAAAQAGKARGATVVTGDPRDLVPEAAAQGRWVIVDELDQADPQATYAPLSSLLGGVPVTFAQGEATPAEHWRLIATWNGETPPRAAVLRRFAVVHVDGPVGDELHAAIKHACSGDATATAAAEKLTHYADRVGVGVLLDAARHAAARQAAVPTDPDTLAQELLAAYIAPLIEP